MNHLFCNVSTKRNHGPLQSRLHEIWRILAALVFLLSLIGMPTRSVQAADSTVSLVATADTRLRTSEPTTNYGAETTVTMSPSSSSPHNGLFLWDLSSIPATVNVTSASITFRVTERSTYDFSLYELIRNWGENTATWESYDGTNSWGADGATGSTDRNSIDLWDATTSTFNTSGSVTIPLNTSGVAVVQKWVVTPSSNYGVTVQYAGSSGKADYWIVASSEAATASQRPTLNITYNTSPIITTSGTLSAFTTRPGVASDTQSYTVTGGNLNDDITITAPAGFRLSKDGTTYSSSVTLSPLSGAVASTTIYAQLYSATEGSFSGNIVHASTGATEVDIAVSGTVSNTVCSTVNLTAIEDTYLSASDVTYNNGGNTEIHVNRTTGTSRRSALLKWDLSSIPATATVSSSSISLDVTNTSTVAYDLYNMRQTWVEGTSSQAESSNSANWNTYDGINSWGTIGAASTTLDRYNTNLWNSTTTSFSTTGIKTVALNTSGVETVQGWIAGSLSNHGLIIQTYSGSSNDLYFSSSEATTAANRPTLNVTYCYTLGPTIITTSSLSDFTGNIGVASAEQTYTVAGANLTNDITITAPSDFEISKTSGSGFGSTVTLSPTSGTIATTTVYAHFLRSTAGTSSGNITHTSNGATQVNVPVSGTASNGAPTVTLAQPTDGATEVSTPPTLSVTVTDPDVDTSNVSFYGRPVGSGSGEDFTIVVIPDPQNYATSYPSTYTAHLQWIADYKSGAEQTGSSPIVFATAVGDLVNTSTSATEYGRADTAFATLDTGQVQYSVGPGNHDMGGSTLWPTYFGTSRFSSKTYYGGSYDNYNNYYLFSASGMDFILINLQYSPTTAVLNWADARLKEYPNHRAIIEQHDILNANNSWNNMTSYTALKDNPNLFLMLCGHMHTSSDGAAYRAELGDDGHTIHIVMADYQDFTNSGYLRLLCFSPANDMIYMTTYSPTTGLTIGSTSNYDKADLAYDMSSSEPFTLIGTANNAASGSNASITWTGLADTTEYEWYAVANDGTATTTSDTWSFTTGIAVINHTITASAGTGGSIDPSGTVTVTEGANQTFTITTDAGYHVTDVLVDGSSVGAVTSYTFSNVSANHTIAANFAVDTFTIVASAGTGGSISPTGSVSANYGADQTFTITPTTGYHVIDILVDSDSVGAVTEYTFANVKADHTIAASFAVDTFTIAASAGTGGSISPTGSVSVNYGADQTFTITPSTGYHVADVLVDGDSIGVVTEYTFINVKANHTIAASFAVDINTHTITATASEHGGITPSGAVTVVESDYQEFVIEPDSGYQVNDVLVDGVSAGAVTSYTFNNVTSDHTIAASFEPIPPKEYTIAATVGSHGSITPSGIVTVTEGSDLTFTIAPDSGYQIDDVLVDGVSVGMLETYTFENVQANHTIVASFKVIPPVEYTIAATAGEHGSINPAGAVVVIKGSDQEFVITPDSGYQIVDVLVDGASVGAVETYTFENVQANHTITASFQEIPPEQYTIAATAGEHGNITPSGVVTVIEGGSQSFSITPESGYQVDDVLVDGASVGAVETYTFDNVQANHTIVASFKIIPPKEYTIAATAGEHGSITPAGAVTVIEGGSQSFSITPEVGYQIGDVLVDGVSVGAVETYTFNNIQANHTIVASFKIIPPVEYTIVAMADANGSIDPPGTIVVGDGADQTFVIKENDGYHIADVLVDGTSVGAVSNYTFEDVNADHTISASFAQDEYSLTVVSAHGAATKIPDKPTYHYGDVVTLSMTAENGWTFTNWTPALIDNKVTILGDTTITANFVQNEYTLTINIVGDGTVTRDDNGPYHLNDVVILTAVAETGWTFMGWSACTGSDVCSVTMDGNKTVTATFVSTDVTPPYTEIINFPAKISNNSTAEFLFIGRDNLTSPGDLTFECKLDDSAWTVCYKPIRYKGLADGTHTFSARAKDAAGNVDPNPPSFTWTIITTQGTYALTINKVGSGTVVADPAAPYYYGTEVTLTATADAGYTFSGWSGACMGTGGCTVTMDANKAVTATFTQNTHTLTVAVAGSGTTNPTVGVHAYAVGTIVNITATPATGYEFDHWTGACTGSDACSVTMDGNKTVTAIFVSAADVIPPYTEIINFPAKISNNSTVEFLFIGRDNVTSPGDLTFECKLDDSAWTVCYKPIRYKGLADGTHTFSARAKDAAGNVDPNPPSFTWTIITNRAPVANAGGPYFGNEGATIKLSASKSTDPDNNLVLYAWDLDNDGLFDDATGKLPTFKAVDNGVFKVRVRVTDAEGLNSIDSSIVTVKNLPPAIKSLSFNKLIRVGATVNTRTTFKDAGVKDTFIATWKWGDNTTSTGTVNNGTVSGSHVYAKPGVYLVTILIKDKDGGIGQISKWIIVLPKK